jgi:hypothetical protein
MDGFEVKHSIAGATIRTVSSTSTQVPAAVNVTNRSQTNMAIVETGSVRYKSAALDAVTQVELIYGKADADLEMQVGAIRTRPLAVADTAQSFILDQGVLHAADGERGILPHDFVLSSMVYNVPHGATVGNVAFGTLSTAGAALMDTFAVESRAFGVRGDGRTAVRMRDLSGIDNLDDTYSLVAANASGQLRFKRITNAFKSDVELRVPITVAGLANGYTDAYIERNGVRVLDFDTLAADEDAFVMDAAQLQAVRTAAGSGVVTFHVTNGIRASAFSFRILDGPFYRVHGEGSVVDTVPKVFIDLDEGYAHHVAAPFDRSVDYPGYALRLVNTTDGDGKQGSMITAMQFTGINADGANAAPVAIVVGDNYADPTFEMDGTLQAPTSDRVVSTGRLRIQLADETKYLTTAADVRPTYARFVESLYSGGSYAVSAPIAAHVPGSAIIRFDGDSVMAHELAVGHVLTVDEHGVFTVMHISAGGDVTLSSTVLADLTNAEASVRLGSGDFAVNSGSLKADVFNMAPSDRFMTLDGNLRVGAARGTYINSRTLSIGGSAPGDSGLFVRHGNAFINVTGTTDIASTTFRVGPRDTDDTPHFWLMANGARSSMRAPGDLDISTSANATVEATGNLHLYGDDAIYVTSAGVLDIGADRTDARYATGASLSVGGLHAVHAGSANTIVVADARLSVGGVHAVSVGGAATRVIVGADTTSAGAIALTSESDVRVQSTTDSSVSAGGNVQLAAVAGSARISAGDSIVQVAQGNVALSAGVALDVRSGQTLSMTSPYTEMRASDTLKLSAGGLIQLDAPDDLRLNGGSIAIEATSGLDANVAYATNIRTGTLVLSVADSAAMSVGNAIAITTGGPASLTVTNGPLVLSTSGAIFKHTDANLAVTATGTLSLSAGGAASMRAASLTANVAGAVQLNTGGALDVSVVGDVRLTTAGNVHAVADGALSLGVGGPLELTVDEDATVSVAGNVTVSVARSVGVTATSVDLSVADDIVMSAAGNGGIALHSNNASVIVDGNIRLNGANSTQQYSDDYDVSVGGLITLESVGRALVATSDTLVLTADEAMTLSTGAGFVLAAVGNAYVGVGGDLDIDSDANVHVRAGTSLAVEAVGNIAVESGAALAVAVVDGMTVSAGGALVAVSGAYMRATVAQAVDLSAGGNVHVRTDGVLSIDAADAFVLQTDGTGRVDVASELALSVGANAVVAVEGLATVSIGDALTVSVAGDVRLVSAASMGTQVDGTYALSVGGNVALVTMANASLSVQGGLDMKVTDDLSLVALANADLYISKELTVSVDRAAALGAERVTISAIGFGASAGAVDIDATGDVRLSAGGAYALFAVGASSSVADGNMFIQTAQTLDVRARDVLALVQADANVSIGGDLIVGAGGDLATDAANVHVHADRSLLLESADTVTLESGGAFALTVADAATLSVGSDLDVRVGANAHLAAVAGLSMQAHEMRAVVVDTIDVSAGGALQLTSAHLDVDVVGAAAVAVGTSALISVGGSTRIFTAGGATLDATGALDVRTADAFALSVSGNAALAVVRDLAVSAGGALAVATGADGMLTVARDLDVSVGGELAVAGDGNAVILVGGDTDVSVGGSLALAVADAVEVLVADEFALRSANVLLVGTDLARTNAISVAGSMDIRVSGALLVTSAAGAAQTDVGTDYAVHALQGSLSLGAATTTTLSTGTHMRLGAAEDISLSAGDSLYVTSGALVDVAAAQLSVDLTSNAFVRATDATVQLTAGDFTLSTSAAVRMTALTTINMVAPDGLLVNALDGLSMGSAIGGAGNIVLNRTDGLVAATTTANIHLYSTAADGPSLRYDDQGGAVRVANQHTFEVTGASGRFDVSVNSAYFTNDLIVRGDLRVLGDQVVEGGTVQLQTRDLNIEDKCIELAVIVQDEANTVVAVGDMRTIGDFSLSADLTTLSPGLGAPIKFPQAGRAAWPWFRPYDAATAPAGAGTYLASLVRPDFDVQSTYANRELFIRTDGHQDLANGVIYDSFVTHARFERAFAVPEGNIVLLRTSGSVVQPDGANVDVYSNAFLYGLNGDYSTPTWADDAATGVFASKAPSMAIKYYNDTMADQGGIKLRANKLESVMWYKATGAQTRPYWRMTSDLFIGDKNAFHFAAPGTEDSAHWFMFVDPTTGSLVYAFGTVQSYLIASALDRPMAI